MVNCPNCENRVCVNTSYTHLSNFIDLTSESNLFELENNENVMLMKFILPQDFLDEHVPRSIPQKIPRPFSISLLGGDMMMLPGVVSITCKNSPFVFEYNDFDADLEYLDN